MASPLPPPSWGPLDVLGPSAPAAPMLDRPAGLVGEPGPGVLDLSLPTDQALFAAASPDPQQQFGLIRDAQPGRIADTATTFARAGTAMDGSVAHSQAALTQLGSAFTNNGAGVYDAEVYDADTHWGRSRRTTAMRAPAWLGWRFGSYERSFDLPEAREFVSRLDRELADATQPDSIDLDVQNAICFGFLEMLAPKDDAGGIEALPEGLRREWREIWHQ